MNQEHLFDEVPVEKFEIFMTREELITFLKLEQNIRIQIQKDNQRLRVL